MGRKRFSVIALLAAAALSCFYPAVAIASGEEQSASDEAQSAVDEDQSAFDEDQSALDEEDTVLEEELQRQPAKGILPQLTVWLRLPEGIRLYDPEKPRPPDERLEYNRRFPIGGEEVINQGYALPLPTGISLIYVSNLQDQEITDLNLAFGKGVVPPVDAPLRPFPAVGIGSESDTESAQLKGDVWVLPFLNVYATLGKVTGDASVNVIIDLANAPEICIPDPRPTLPGQPPRPPICRDSYEKGSFLLPIRSEVDRNAATLGITGAFSIDKWFTSLTAAYTDTWGKKASNVTTVNAGIRAGRRFFLGSGHTLVPYFGVNYLDIDTRVQGVATLMDAFPNGDDFNVRYDIKLDNTDKYSGIAGLGFGFTNGMAVQLEWNKSANSERFVLAVEKRF